MNHTLAHQMFKAMEDLPPKLQTNYFCKKNQIAANNSYFYANQIMYHKKIT